ncbi:MAG TPA: hypothetical protein VKQ36_04415 [Ktedonobacterales bacterium]|nr:hypothetical protein [Ktedonobacterales bacterium]
MFPVGCILLLWIAVVGAILVLCFIGGLSILSYFLGSVTGAENGAFIAILCGLVIAGLIFYYRGVMVPTNARARRQRVVWSRLMYCEREHIVFDPATQRYAPAEATRSLLPS